MWREVRHTVSGPGKIESDFGGLTVSSDHPDPADPGKRSPPPWFLFLASLGACVTSFVAGRLHELGVDPAGVTVIQRQEYAEDDEVIPEFSFVIRLPEDVRAEDRESVLSAARECTVKRVIEAAPAFSFRIE